MCPEGLFKNIFPRLFYDLVDSWFKLQLSDKALWLIFCLPFQVYHPGQLGEHIYPPLSLKTDKSVETEMTSKIMISLSLLQLQICVKSCHFPVSYLKAWIADFVVILAQIFWIHIVEKKIFLISVLVVNQLCATCSIWILFSYSY